MITTSARNVYLAIHITRELKRRIRDAAAEENVPMSVYVSRILTKWTPLYQPDWMIEDAGPRDGFVGVHVTPQTKVAIRRLSNEEELPMSTLAFFILMKAMERMKG